MNDSLIEAMIRYRTYLRISPPPSSEETTPLIVSWHTGKAIGGRHINKLLKGIALIASKKFINQPDKCAKLRLFSAHWIRHLSAIHQDEEGIPFKYIKENHRHQSDETTRRYVHTREKERYAQMQKLQLSFKGSS